jgi:hypothetical protein
MAELDYDSMVSRYPSVRLPARPTVPSWNAMAAAREPTKVQLELALGYRDE